ncbi:MAG: aspartate kinase [Thermoanaerobaculales bacterium]|nr:aspartate kinase [Thermoanaerobaculales bacterium]
MRVLKFGGSSVADADRIARVVAIVAAARSEEPVVVVASALGGVTDELVALTDRACSGIDPDSGGWTRLRTRHTSTLHAVAPGDDAARRRLLHRLDEAQRLIKGVAYIADCPPAVRDRILATGERLSAPIIAAALEAAGQAATPVDGGELIRTDSSFGGAAIDQEATDHLAGGRLAELAETRIPVVTGFIGADADGSTTTLGRGGSDLTATVLGAAVGAGRVEIWTDVNGIFTAPPRVVPGARPQPTVSYDEAAELARFGAAVLFTRTVAPVRRRSIPVVVRNTFQPDGPSTWVDEGPDVPSGARSLASVERAAVLTVHPADANGTPAGEVAHEAPHCLIAALAAATGEWTLVTEEKEVSAIVGRLRAAGLSVTLVEGASIVSVVGSRLLQQPWVAGRALEALGRRDVSLKGVVSPSEHSVCVVVDREDHDRALSILHEALMLSHLANRAADAVRRKLASQGVDDDSNPLHGRSDRRDGNGGTTARPPAA